MQGRRRPFEGGRDGGGAGILESYAERTIGASLVGVKMAIKCPNMSMADGG
jgi:hypothetical protein